MAKLLYRYQWYALKTMTGAELQVANALRTQMLEAPHPYIAKVDGVLEILPEKGNGKHLFKGFIYVKMHLSEESIQWIKKTPKLLGFISGKTVLDIPTVSVDEVEHMRQKTATVASTAQLNAEQNPSTQKIASTQIEAQARTKESNQTEAILDSIVHTTHQHQEMSLNDQNQEIIENDLVQVISGALLYQVGEDVRITSDLYQQRGSSKIQAIHYPTNRLDKAQLTINFGSTPFRLSFKDIDKAFTIHDEVTFTYQNKLLSGKIVQVHHQQEEDSLKTFVTIKYKSQGDAGQLLEIVHALNPAQIRVGQDLLVSYDDHREIHFAKVSAKNNFQVILQHVPFDFNKRKPKFFEVRPVRNANAYQAHLLNLSDPIAIKNTSIVAHQPIKTFFFEEDDYLLINGLRIIDLYKIDLSTQEGKNALVRLINQQLQAADLEITCQIKNDCLRFDSLAHISIEFSREEVAMNLGFPNYPNLNTDLTVSISNDQVSTEFIAKEPIQDFDLTKLKNAYIDINGHRVTSLKYQKNKEEDLLHALNHPKSGVKVQLDDSKLSLSAPKGNIRLQVSKDFSLIYSLGIADLCMDQFHCYISQSQIISLNRQIASTGIVWILDDKRLRASAPFSFYDAKFAVIRDAFKNLIFTKDFDLSFSFSDDQNLLLKYDWLKTYVPAKRLVKECQLLELSQVTQSSHKQANTDDSLKLALQIVYRYEGGSKQLEQEIYYIGEALDLKAQRYERKSTEALVFSTQEQHLKLQNFDQCFWINVPNDLSVAYVERPARLVHILDQQFDHYIKLSTDQIQYDYPKAIVKKRHQDKGEEIALISLINQTEEYWVSCSDLKKL
jgi:transcription antitermination factor NusG